MSKTARAHKNPPNININTTLDFYNWSEDFLPWFQHWVSQYKLEFIMDDEGDLAVSLFNYETRHELAAEKVKNLWDENLLRDLQTEVTAFEKAATEVRALFEEAKCRHNAFKADQKAKKELERSEEYQSLLIVEQETREKMRSGEIQFSERQKILKAARDAVEAKKKDMDENRGADA